MDCSITTTDGKYGERVVYRIIVISINYTYFDIAGTNKTLHKLNYQSNLKKNLIASN